MSNERDTSPVITQEKLLEYHNNLVYPFLNGVSTKGDQAFVPCGKIEGFMRTTAPKGYLVCDGTEYLKSAYPSLAAVLGVVDTAQSTTNFAGSDANHFKVPDLRGEFLRGTGTNGHTNQGNGGNVGQHQDATEFPSIELNGSSLYYLKSNIGQSWTKFYNNIDSSVSSPSMDNFNNSGNYGTGSSGSMKTSRPTNTSVLYCIAYEDLYLTPRHTYSTDEQVVGTWIDGKPIYEKVINETFPVVTVDGTVTSKNVDVSTLNIDKIINIGGVSGSGFSLNRCWGLDGKYYNMVGYTGSDILLQLNRESDGYSATIILQYTKTTDTPTT